jgi:hypothetical protein
MVSCQFVEFLNMGHANLKFQLNQVRIPSIYYRYMVRVLLRYYISYSYSRGGTTLPLKRNLDAIFESRMVLTVTTNSCTFPYYGNSKSGWWERRKSSLAQVVSSLVWLLH